MRGRNDTFAPESRPPPARAETAATQKSPARCRGHRNRGMFDMTCKELRWYFEDHLRDAEVRSARGAVAEHAATCPDCSRFVAEQRELGGSLREIRESAGPVPQSVDASVLLNYRLHMADQSTRHEVRINRKLRPRLAWSFAAIGVGLLVLV